MADRKMKMRTRAQDGGVELQVLITHPMETGLRTDKNTGKKIPPHFIQRITLEHNGKIVATVNTGAGISEDPLIGFRLKDAKQGDKLKVFWSDNMGESATLEGVVDIS
ncbi:MAG: thiosulfate oxidation carrier complex protein SoxZ [Sulfuricaulis sp.]|uniref:thiosulfate oxidation carrier complex protein SoxZ n=1 Tax=Sulfuricaulis sp. TaxID=2003553 RepID=UPI0025E58BB8|nr:thiosulfate oxidation carrier complex protein SoxZ [Sulfuricaulis sp.]MCR4345698.1 thiosulfate oxidation carrier complex protein SoxZ [Sulfuricaulis sp.]